MRAFVLSLLLGSLLAGCAQGPRDPGAVALPAGTGGILGNAVTTGHQAPVANVTVLIYPGPFVATTDVDGKFVLRGVPPGEYRGSASASGFESSPRNFTVPAGDYAEVVFFMERVG